MNRTWKQIFLLVATVFVVYSNTLDNDFVWDDIPLITGNIAVQNARYALRHLGRDFHPSSKLATASSGPRYWRPLVLLTFTSDYSLWGNTPAGFHLTNILLHALNAILVLLLLRKFPASRGIAFPASLLFALHPLQTNAVSYISGRTDLLASLFFLLAAIAFVRYTDGTPQPSAKEYKGNNGRFALVWLALCLFLSLTAKEASLAAPLVFLVVAALEETPSRKRVAAALSVSAGVIGVYLVARYLAGVPLTILPSSAAPAPRAHLLAVAQSIVLYARLFLLPTGLRMERFLSIPAVNDPLALLCAALVLLAAAAVARSLVRGEASGLFIAWSFVAFLPASNIIPIYGSIASEQLFLGEQFLYLPLAGLCAAAAIFFNRSDNRPLDCRPFTLYTGIAVLCLMGALSYLHNEYWRDEQTFYSETLRRYPGSVRMSSNLGLLYARQGNLDEAERLLRNVVEQNPLSARARLNLGIVYRKQGRLDAARKELRNCVALDPGLTSAYCELGLMDMSLGRPEAAAREYRKAIAASPLHLDARVNLAAALMQQGDHAGAVAVLRETLSIDPRSLQARTLLARALTYLGRDDEASEQYQILKEMYPELPVSNPLPRR